MKGARAAARVLVVVPVLAALFFGAWAIEYPSSGDPKSIPYVFWKAGLPTMDLDVATSTMVHATNAGALVVGKTRAQLQRRFGTLTALADASPYLRGCYERSPWKGRDVLFIRSSPWMVVLDGERATELVLVKGC